MNRKWRLYLDTSVFGGCFDMVQGWAEDSRRVVASFLRGRAVLFSSELLEQEIASAPPAVRDVFLSIPNAAVEEVCVSAEIDELAHAYVRAGVTRESAGWKIASMLRWPLWLAQMPWCRGTSNTSSA